MGRIYFTFKKSFLREQGITKEDIEKGLAILAKDLEKAFKEKDFAYFKKRAISCLKKQYKELEKEEQENKNITKAFSLAELELKKAFPVGTIRTWKGKKFIKSPDKKWRPYYEKKGSQGEKLALAALAKKINALQDGDYEGLYKLLTLHRSRFTSDKSLIKDLYDAMKKRGALGSGRFTKKETEKKEEPKKEVKTEKKEKETKKEESEVKENTEEEKEDDTFDINEIPNDVPENFKEITVKDRESGEIEKYVKGDNSDYKGVVYNEHNHYLTRLLHNLKDPYYYEILTIDMGEGKKRVVRKYKELEPEVEDWEFLPYIAHPDPKTMEQALKGQGVAYNPVKKFKKIPSEEEIINNLANYDGTKGSCTSLALCYVAQKLGYDVTDFRGGWSKELFSAYARDVIQYLFAEGYTPIETDLEEVALKLLKQLREGEANKQFLLFAGQHCAIVRKNKESGELQYLELQGGDEYKGWKNFNKTPKEERDNSTVDENGFSEDFKEGLRKRFGTDITAKEIIYSALFSIDVIPKKKNDFLRLMGYINSKGGPQRVLTRQE